MCTQSNRHCINYPMLSLKPGFHYPSWQPKLTGDRFPTRLVKMRARQHDPCWRIMETGHLSTRAVNSGSGNRALVSSGNELPYSTCLLVACTSTSHSKTYKVNWSYGQFSTDYQHLQSTSCKESRTPPLASSVNWSHVNMSHRRSSSCTGCQWNEFSTNPARSCTLSTTS